MNPQELEACVLAGLLNGGASPDAFDVIASTPEESFSIGFYRRTFSEIKKQALTSGMIDMLFISEALGGSSLAKLAKLYPQRQIQRRTRHGGFFRLQVSVIIGAFSHSGLTGGRLIIQSVRRLRRSRPLYQAPGTTLNITYVANAAREPDLFNSLCTIRTIGGEAYENVQRSPFNGLAIYFCWLTITANGKNFSFGSERRISLSLSVSPRPISVAVIVSQNLR